MRSVEVEIMRLPHAADLPLPAYESAAAAGLDLRAAVEAPLVIEPATFSLVPTGIALALPSDHEGQVRPRSGLAARHGVTVLNAPGTIDADYRGEVRVVLINHSQVPFRVERGDRIAQLVIAPVSRCRWREVDDLRPTERGEGGFGSTGGTTS